MQVATPHRKSLVLTVLLITVGHAVVQKGIVYFFDLPDQPALITKEEYKKHIQTQYPRVAPTYLALGVCALLLAFFLTSCPITKPALTVLGFLWVFRGYSTIDWGTHEKLMQFLFLLGVLAVVCYFAFRKSTKIKS